MTRIQGRRMIRPAHAAFGVVHRVEIGYVEARVIVWGLDPGRHDRVVVVHGGQER